MRREVPEPDAQPRLTPIHSALAALVSYKTSNAKRIMSAGHLARHGELKKYVLEEREKRGSK